jgi:hypothetical protein
VDTTPEQCLMCIATIAHQAQGMRAGEVIAKLAEDAYFMRVDNRVTQVPPVRNRQQDNEATSRSVDISRNRTRGELLANPTMILAAEAATEGAPTMGLAGEPGAEATVADEATRTATPPALHVAASTPARRSKNFDARSPPRQATTMASPPSLHGFTIYISCRNSNLWGSPSTT